MRGLEQARYQARRSFKRRIAEKETQNPAIIAKAGNGAGTVVVSGRAGWIYVRLHGDDNQLTEAKLGIPLDTGSLNDAWVRVKRASPRKTSYYVFQEFITSSTGDPAPPMSAHPLDPDAGPHTGQLPEDDVAFDDATGHDHQGAADTGKKVDTKDLADTDGQLLTGGQKTDLTDGGTTVLHQHAGGATDSVLITLTNQTGGQRTAGDVVVSDPDNNESFVGTTAVGYQGKVLVVGETIADLTGGLCWERGGPFDVKVTGAVSRNDGLRTSATIYRAEAAPSITGGGVFAVALAPNISGEGTVKAVFLDAIGGGGGGDGVGTIEIQEDDVKVIDASIVNFEGGGGKVTDEGGGKATVNITPGAGGDHYVTELIHWFHQSGGVEANVGNVGVLQLGNNDQGFFNFHLASDFDEIITAVIIILPDATEQVQWDERTSYGATGEAWGTPSETLDNLTKNVTLNQFAELDVSGVLTGVAAGDHVGLSIISNTDTLRVAGLLLRYKTT